MENKWLVNETTVVDQSTGELLTTSKKFKVKVNSDDFYMAYIKFIAPLFALNSVTDIKLLVWMCCKAEYNTGRVLVTSEVRKELLKDLNINTSSQISNSIKSLKDRELIKGDRGTYYINPEIFWKGQQDVRKDYISKYPNLTVNFNLE